MRIPGFRPGKAPRQLLEARLGTDIAREQALQDALPQYYVDAVTEHDVDVIAPPEIEITAGQEDGDVEFDAVVEVRPQVQPARLRRAARSSCRSRRSATSDVDQQVDALRDRFADLADSDFPLIDEAYATIDISGDDRRRSGRRPHRDRLLVPRRFRHGRRPSSTTSCAARSPARSSSSPRRLPERFGEHAGNDGDVPRVIVKEAKQKVLPELTDEWASEASEFDTVDELRADVRKRLEMMQKLQAQMAVRDKVLEAAADLRSGRRARRRSSTAKRAGASKISRTGFHIRARRSSSTCRRPGQEPQAFIDEIRVGAGQAVLADLALRAVVAQEEIAATDDELDAEIARLAERAEQKPEKVRRELERSGALETVRSDVARGKALEFLVEHANVVDEDGNAIDLDDPRRRLRTIEDPIDDRHAGTSRCATTRSRKRESTMQNEYVPMPRFIQDTPRGRMEWDPYSRLANDRIIFLGTPVDDTVANLLIAQLLILESEDPDKDIIMYINSPGGEITGLFAIYDTMQYIKPDVQTCCIGQAASAAAVLLASGAPGKRFILPHARVLIHQPHGGASGQAVDIEIQAKEIVRMRELLDEILAFHTGQALDRVAQGHRPRLHHERSTRPRTTASSTRSSPTGSSLRYRRPRARASQRRRARGRGGFRWRSSVTAAIC